MTALFALLSACTSTPADPPDVKGPYDVGTTTLEVVDPRGKPLTIEVWYPSLPDQGEPSPYPPTILTFDAVRDAEPVVPESPWPLVAFSHGHVAIRYQSAFLTEHLATHGFVVVAPDHTKDTLLDVDESDIARILLERPDDVRYAIDAAIEAALEPGLLNGLIADGPYAMTGHSFGALTALIVGGGDVDLQGAIDECADGGGTNRVCDLITPEVAQAAAGYGTADDRVVATVAMSPFAWYAFRDRGAGLASVRKPLVLAGELDEVTEYADEIVPVFENLGSPRKMLEFERAGHYSFSDICLLVPALFPECDPDAGFQDLAEVQRLTRQAVTAYLKVELAGDDRYTEWVEPDGYVDVPEVQLRSE
ncbi:MAG: hypothetical protein R3F61_37510 [Myxococcota bacterium]